MKHSGKSRHNQNHIHDDAFISDIPSKYHSFNGALHLVVLNPQKLPLIPQCIQCRRFYLLALKQNAEVFRYIPAEEINYSLCEEAVALNCETIKYIPEAFKTKRIYRILISNHPTRMDLIPEDERTYDIYISAVRKLPENIMSTPEHFKTTLLCQLALAGGNGHNLLFVPLRLQNMQMCIYALRNGCPIRYIPTSIQNTPRFAREVKALSKTQLKTEEPESENK